MLNGLNRVQWIELVELIELDVWDILDEIVELEGLLALYDIVHLSNYPHPPGLIVTAERMTINGPLPPRGKSDKFKFY